MDAKKMTPWTMPGHAEHAAGVLQAQRVASWPRIRREIMCAAHCSVRVAACPGRPGPVVEIKAPGGDRRTGKMSGGPRSRCRDALARRSSCRDPNTSGGR